MRFPKRLASVGPIILQAEAFLSTTETVPHNLIPERHKRNQDKLANFCFLPLRTLVEATNRQLDRGSAHCEGCERDGERETERKRADWTCASGRERERERERETARGETPLSLTLTKEKTVAWRPLRPA